MQWAIENNVVKIPYLSEFRATESVQK
jgi:hypothetical protein